MSQPSTQVSRLSELQVTSRDALFELLGSTPLATVALVRDGHPVVFPTGFARIDEESGDPRVDRARLDARAEFRCARGRFR